MLMTLLLGASVAAHDLWIEPSTFQAAAGSPVSLRLRVGVDLLGDPVARDPELIERFISVHPSGTRPVPGAPGVDPAGLLRVPGDGLTIVGYASKPSVITLPGAKFTEYLKEEGLERIIALRAQRGETDAEAREAFSRCAKTLLSAGTANGPGDRALGLTLELIAEKNPYALQPGQTLPVRLLYKDQPIEGVLVVAINKKNPAEKVSARSGRDGRVQLALAQPGMWLVKAVHMVETDGGEAQWSSYWASLTFRLPDAAAGVAGR